MGLLMSKYKVSMMPANASSPSIGYEWLQMPGVSLGVVPKPELFEISKPIGKGKFGIVFTAQLKCDDGKFVAIKYIPKQAIYDNNAIDKIQLELDLLGKIDHPFSVYCYGAFDAQACIAVVMDFAVGGELYHRMKQRIRFSEEEARFYFIEIVSLLKYLHEDMGIVYRDLKPENILIDYAGHIKVCDYGFSTPSSKTDPDLQDSCGTVMYISPEVVTRMKHSFPVDWWAAGCILVEMLTGHAPFGDSDDCTRFEIFNNITERTVRLPIYYSGAVRGLVKGLLQKNQDQRMDSIQVVQTSWLKDVNWKDVHDRKLQPPWVPSNAANKPGSVANFVSWNLALPTAVPTSEVMGYSRTLRLPKPRGSQPNAPRMNSSMLDASPSMKGALRKTASTNGPKKSVTLQTAPSNATLQTSPSSSAMLAQPSSSGKLKKGRSSKVVVASDEAEDIPTPPTIESPSPGTKRSKSAKNIDLDTPLDAAPSTKRSSKIKVQNSSSQLVDDTPAARPESAAKKKKQKSQKLDRQASQK